VGPGLLLVEPTTSILVLITSALSSSSSYLINTSVVLGYVYRASANYIFITHTADRDTVQKKTRIQVNDVFDPKAIVAIGKQKTTTV
jgi:hypothetical protein